jgi:hypothetical protein
MHPQDLEIVREEVLKDDDFGLDEKAPSDREKRFREACREAIDDLLRPMSDDEPPQAT